LLALESQQNKIVLKISFSPVNVTTFFSAQSNEKEKQREEKNFPIGNSSSNLIKFIFMLFLSSFHLHNISLFIAAAAMNASCNVRFAIAKNFPK